jgi:hypothetical protein
MWKAALYRGHPSKGVRTEPSDPSPAAPVKASNAILNRPTMRFAAFFAIALSAVPLHADFQYQSTAHITGGVMLQMLRFVPGAGKVREPQTSTVAVQGNRMLHKSPQQTSIIDLDKRTITTISTEKKTYSVMPFDQMKQAMEDAAAKAQTAKQPGSPDLSIDANIQQTGQTRNIEGYDTKEAILTMSMTMTDPRSAQSGAMAIKMDMWVAPEVAGYSEVREFYKRMAKDLDWMPGGMALLNRPDMARAIAKMMAQGGALEGTPIQEIVSMRPQAAPGTPEAAPGSSVTSAPAPSQPAPTQNNSQQSPSAAIAGALSGRFGGLGGFGRKKQSQSSQDAAPAAPATSSGDGTLIEMTMENSAFSAAPVNSALFEIPAGFREVPPDMPRTSK